MHPIRVFLTAGLCAALLATAACSTIGGQFGADIGQLKVGQTTEPQAIAVLGPPAGSAPLDQGRTEVTWTRTSDSSALHHQRTVKVIFGADGKMIRVDSKSNAYNLPDR